MSDEKNINPYGGTGEGSDPNAETHHEETAGSSWLDTNVGVRPDEWIGRRIGEFEIIRIIGTGGMGNVYEAKQMHPHRSVALKIVKSAAATPATLHRFEMESEMLARLQHPGIAQVYDSGHQTQDDILLPYFAMEYIPGSCSITDYVEEEHLSRRGRIELFLRVCEAVQYGHGRGVIHRDLKPSNILITSAGRPKVIDFGVALMTDSDDDSKTVTVEGRFVGTLQWSSPEQCGDDPHDVDVRTDVYSLGVLMYQLMTSELPYDLKGVPLYRAPLVIRETQPTLPRKIDDSIAIEIEQILLKALSKERESRYESVADMAMDIRRYLQDQPILAKPPTTMYKLRLYARRNQLKFRAATVVFVALLLGITGLVWGFIESEARQKDMERALVVEATARSIAEQRAYIATIGTAQAAMANNSWDMARHHLAATDRERRGWEWHYLRGMVDQSVRTWLIGDRPTSLTASPTGRHLAITFEGGRIVLIDETRDVTRDVTLPSKVNSVAFSVTGELLFLGMANGNIAILDLLRDTMVKHMEQRAAIESIIAIDANSFATGHADGLIHIWSTDGEHITSLNGNRGMILSLDYTPKQDILAIGTIDGTVQIWKPDGEHPIVQNHLHGGAVRAVNFLDDGRLVSGGDDGNIIVWDLDTNTQTTIESMHAEVMDLTSIGFTIASVGMDGVVRLWSAEQFDLLDTLRGHEDLVWSIEALGSRRFISVGQDGSIRWWSALPAIPTTQHDSSKIPASDIAFVWNDVLVTVSEFDSDMHVFDINENESHIISSDGAELSTVAFVPNTSFAVTGDLDGDVRLWDIETLQQDEVVGSCDSQITAMDVSRNGRTIAVGTLSGQVYVLHRKDCRVLYQNELSDSIILAVSFNEQGNQLFVSTIDGSIIAIDLKSGKILWNRIGNGSDIVAIKYVDTRNAILTATASNRLQLLSDKNGKVIDSSDATGGVLRDVAMFHDESRFVTALSDGTVGVWDTATFSLVASLPSKQSLECISVSRDGYRLAIAGGTATIQLMDGMSRGARLKNSTNKQRD